MRYRVEVEIINKALKHTYSSRMLVLSNQDEGAELLVPFLILVKSKGRLLDRLMHSYEWR